MESGCILCHQTPSSIHSGIQENQQVDNCFQRRAALIRGAALCCFFEEVKNRMQRQIMIVGENLKFCKHLKYEMQDEMLQCYYALNSTDGLRHLRHYPYRLVLYETAKISTDVLHQVGQIRAARPDVLIVVLCPDMGPQDYADVLTTADNFISHICDGQTCKSILEAVLRRSARTDQSAKNRVC